MNMYQVLQRKPYYDYQATLATRQRAILDEEELIAGYEDQFPGQPRQVREALDAAGHGSAGNKYWEDWTRRENNSLVMQGNQARNQQSDNDQAVRLIDSVMGMTQSEAPRSQMDVASLENFEGWTGDTEGPYAASGDAPQESRLLRAAYSKAGNLQNQRWQKLFPSILDKVPDGIRDSGMVSPDWDPDSAEALKNVLMTTNQQIAIQDAALQQSRIRLSEKTHRVNARELFLRESAGYLSGVQDQAGWTDAIEKLAASADSEDLASVLDLIPAEFSPQNQQQMMAWAGVGSRARGGETSAGSINDLAHTLSLAQFQTPYDDLSFAQKVAVLDSVNAIREETGMTGGSRSGQSAEGLNYEFGPVTIPTDSQETAWMNELPKNQRDLERWQGGADTIDVSIPWEDADDVPPSWLQDATDADGNPRREFLNRLPDAPSEEDPGPLTVSLTHDQLLAGPERYRDMAYSQTDFLEGKTRPLWEQLELYDAAQSRLIRNDAKHAIADKLNEDRMIEDPDTQRMVPGQNFIDWEDLLDEDVYSFLMSDPENLRQLPSYNDWRTNRQGRSRGNRRRPSSFMDRFLGQLTSSFMQEFDESR